MNFYKLIIQYKGTHYYGFQIQPDRPTIQEELMKAFKLVAKKDFVKIIGSGRTDAGVHALGQVVRIESDFLIIPDSLVKAMNTKLPLDIRVVKAEYCNEDFHPIYSAIKKEYLYAFSCEKVRSVFSRDLLAYFDFEFDEKLMRDACSIFVGSYDFVNYQVSGTEILNTVRDIYSCELQHYCLDSEAQGIFGNYLSDYFVIKVQGNGFLKQMVRQMVGAIWNVARKKASLKDLEDSLKGSTVKRVGATAPPEGLYLAEVFYP